MRPALEWIRALYQDEEIVGAEVGVFRGRHACQILNRMPQVRLLYLVDPYELYEGYEDANMGLVLRAKEYARKQLLGFDTSRYRWIYEKFRAELIPEPLDFIYIDGSHQYDHVIFDIQEAEKVVKPGGVICGHDYYPVGSRRGHEFGVGRAVRDYYGGNASHARKDWWIVYE